MTRGIVGVAAALALLVAGGIGFVIGSSGDVTQTQEYLSLESDYDAVRKVQAETRQRLSAAFNDAERWRDQYDDIVSQIDDIQAELQQPYVGDIFTARVLHVEDARLRVELCATAPYEGGPLPVTRAPWSVRGDDGVTYAALSTDIPGGYPVETSLDVGECARGTVPVALPDDVSIARVVYNSTLGAASWPVQ